MDLFTYAATLTDTEGERLPQLEQTIERGLKTFVDVGVALLEIRDSRLYRKEHGTFEDYCRERWSIERRRAYQLMDAAEVTQNVKNFSHLPERESHAAPLAHLEPEQQREAWQQVVETAPEGKITAAHVQSVVDTFKDNGSGQKNPALYTSNSDEWYTPNGIIFRVIKAMGGIDTDPCSNSHETPTVPAATHYTIEDDGLAQEWKGRVYMNPPYGREIAEWVDYLFEQYKCGNTTEAIALVPSRTDTAWFRVLRDFPHCFIWGRLNFSDSGNAAPFPSMAVYLGGNMDGFISAFKDIGDIYVRVR